MCQIRFSIGFELHSVILLYSIVSMLDNLIRLDFENYTILINADMDFFQQRFIINY